MIDRGKNNVRLGQYAEIAGNGRGQREGEGKGWKEEEGRTKGRERKEGEERGLKEGRGWKKREGINGVERSKWRLKRQRSTC